MVHSFATSVPELSVVMPCLNEAGTLHRCITTIRDACMNHGITYEIIVADNGSTDDSPTITIAEHCALIHVAERGYGHALRAGIRAASGTYMLIADSDCSYDFAEIPAFLKLLRAGTHFVMGCRLPAGGGVLLPGSMPFIHRWIGNPMLSFLARRLYALPYRDVFCGMRAFTRTLSHAQELHSTGMEYAIEMVMRYHHAAGQWAELPLTYHPDGRSRGSHLRPVGDGLRAFRLLLTNTPQQS